MFEKFITDGLIPESFKRNVDARVRVYEEILINIQKDSKSNKRGPSFDLPLLSSFIIKG